MALVKSSSGDPILTKVAPSARSANQILRTGLARRLEDVVSRRLTLVHAPAGYGKTSLLALWHRLLSERGTPVAWLTPEEDESDPSRFAEYLMAALGNGPSESLPLRAALSAIVNRLSQEKRETVLILDDFHRAASESVCSFVRTLIRLAPPTLHLVIASRDYPSLGQSALAAEEDLLELGVDDLKFTLEEAQALLGTRRRGRARRRRHRDPRGAHRGMADRAADGGAVAAQGPGSCRPALELLRADLGAGAVSFRTGAREPAAGDREHRHAHGHPRIASRAIWSTCSAIATTGRSRSSGWSSRDCSWCRSMHSTRPIDITRCSRRSCGTGYRAAIRRRSGSCTARPQRISARGAATWKPFIMRCARATKN